MFFEDLEDLVKEATAKNDKVNTNITQETSTSSELVSKLAESLEDHESDGNSSLGVAKLLTAIDILSA